MIKYILTAALLLVLLAVPLAADEPWLELVPDHASVSLQLHLSADNQPDAGIAAMGSWNLIDIGAKTLEGDLWRISPFGGGLSYPLLGERFLGVGYDAELPGGQWYSRLLVYAKAHAEVNF